jgi:hypothetical protein
MQDQEVIQAFSPHTSQEAFTDGIGSWRPVRCAQHFDATGSCHACEIQPEFSVVIPDQVFGCLSIRSCFSQLLRHPEIRGRARHIHMDDLSRLQFNDEESKERTEEEVSHLQKITGPHLCRMIAQERFPVLSTSSFWTSVLHIPLNSSFADPNPHLEEFPTDTFCSPESVVGCHLLNQANRLRREPRLSRMNFGFVLPEQAEELTVEAAEASLAGQERVPVSNSEPSEQESPEETGPSSDRPVA